MSSDQPLFSQTKTTGKLRAAANTMPSCSAPWLVAPSPKETSVTESLPAACAAMATPQAIGTPAPTMEFSPTRPWAGAIR